MSKAHNTFDKYVGSRVRMRRIMLGMGQEKIGEALGLTFQQIQKYEKGTTRVGASRAAARFSAGRVDTSTPSSSPRRYAASRTSVSRLKFR